MMDVEKSRDVIRTPSNIYDVVFFKKNTIFVNLSIDRVLNTPLKSLKVPQGSSKTFCLIFTTGISLTTFIKKV